MPCAPPPSPLLYVRAVHAFMCIARRGQHDLPSQTRVELCLHTSLDAFLNNQLACSSLADSGRVVGTHANRRFLNNQLGLQKKSRPRVGSNSQK